MKPFFSDSDMTDAASITRLCELRQRLDLEADKSSRAQADYDLAHREWLSLGGGVPLPGMEMDAPRRDPNQEQTPEEEARCEVLENQMDALWWAKDAAEAAVAEAQKRLDECRALISGSTDADSANRDVCRRLVPV